MSVEAQVITMLVEEGSLQKAFQAGISEYDFEYYEEEFRWIVGRIEQKRPVNERIFKQAFPEFDLVVNPKEKLVDLLDELKRERAFLAVNSAIDEVLSGSDPLDAENAVVKASELREILGEVLRLHAPHSDIAIKTSWERAYERQKSMRLLAESGQSVGIPTGVTHFDFHFGGWQKETSYLILGRPGDAKSFLLAKAVIEAAWAGYRVGFFSPEMTEWQTLCRFHTLLSAKKEVQEALGLKGAFRNRSLKDGRDFNLKAYKRFLQWLDNELPGEMYLFTSKYRREKMSASYIESRIHDLGLDMVVIDPIYKLKSPKRRGSRWEELQEITDGICDLAHSYNIPVLMSNQASRALQGNKGEAPSMDSSFGADAPVQEANCVIGVRHFSEERIMKILCSKNRDGDRFKFSAKFFPNVGILEDVTPLQGHTAGYDTEAASTLYDAIMEEGTDING